MNKIDDVCKTLHDIAKNGKSPYLKDAINRIIQDTKEACIQEIKSVMKEKKCDETDFHGRIAVGLIAQTEVYKK